MLHRLLALALALFVCASKPAVAAKMARNAAFARWEAEIQHPMEIPDKPVPLPVSAMLEDAPRQPAFVRIGMPAAGVLITLYVGYGVMTAKEEATK